jgi:hypothetical protein
LKGGTLQMTRFAEAPNDHLKRRVNHRIPPGFGQPSNLHPMSVKMVHINVVSSTRRRHQQPHTRGFAMFDLGHGDFAVDHHDFGIQPRPDNLHKSPKARDLFGNVVVGLVRALTPSA